MKHETHVRSKAFGKLFAVVAFAWAAPAKYELNKSVHFLLRASPFYNQSLQMQGHAKQYLMVAELDCLAHGASDALLGTVRLQGQRHIQGASMVSTMDPFCQSNLAQPNPVLPKPPTKAHTASKHSPLILNTVCECKVFIS